MAIIQSVLTGLAFFILGLYIALHYQYQCNFDGVEMFFRMYGLAIFAGLMVIKLVLRFKKPKSVG